MARIYKGSRYILQLLIGKTYGAQYKDIKIFLYTKNPNNQVMAGNNITIKGNIAEVKIESTIFDNIEDGLIKYIVYGTKDGVPFIEERQSNYYLKSNIDPESGELITCNLEEDVYVEPSMSDVDDNGYIIIVPSSGYDGMLKATVSPIKIYDEGFDNGYENGLIHQKGLLETLTVEENGVFTSENGWKEVNVNIPDDDGSYDDGYEAGKGDGYTEGYSEGYNFGVNDVKNNAQTLFVTKNGTYTDDKLYKFVKVTVIPNPNVYSDAYQKLNEISHFDVLTGNFNAFVSNKTNTSLTGYFDHYDFSEYNPTLLDYEYGETLRENNIEDLRNMASSENYMGNFYLDCSKVKYVEGAFSGWSELVIIGEMKNLGMAFITPQTLSFEDSPKLFSTVNANKYSELFINSLYDFSAGPNTNGVTTSTIKFNNQTNGYDRLKTLLEQKGWTVI